MLATARRYAGRGAEFEDLAQEGYLALVELIPLCLELKPDSLPMFLKSRLPGRVRAYARRCWRCAENFVAALDDLEGTSLEPPAPQVDPDGEIDLERLLAPDEIAMARMLADGYSQAEVAERLGITQQAVSKRLARMRERLREDM